MRKLIAIVDNKANDLVGPPWLYRHEAQAVRQFADLVNDRQTQLSKHPEDYDIVELATLDDDTLEITPSKRTILTGRQYLAAQTAQLELVEREA